MDQSLFSELREGVEVAARVPVDTAMSPRKRCVRSGLAKYLAFIIININDFY